LEFNFDGPPIYRLAVLGWRFALNCDRGPAARIIVRGRPIILWLRITTAAKTFGTSRS
jgi:hypothetical protein